jgi:hypothetical protein
MRLSDCLWVPITTVIMYQNHKFLIENLLFMSSVLLYLLSLVFYTLKYRNMTYISWTDKYICQDKVPYKLFKVLKGGSPMLRS